ncbi:SseB family protein [Rothia endophytica]|uniref:SseB family protein n=1 Tax=Rothia endophytica TaxID=1324766 RepID=UPI001F400B5A|nr:SseB family protein [Rothia endophytica]
MTDFSDRVHRAHTHGHGVGGGAKRDLPAHIAAQLASAGQKTDTGGQPWEGRNLAEGTSHTHQYPGDQGTTDPALQQVFDAFVAGEVDEAAVVDALRNVRIFAPVVAQLSQAEITEAGLVSDKESDMALVSIQAPDGRKALPIFTAVDALTGWHDLARPVAADMRKTALSAVEDENQLIVINPGQNLTFVLRRPAFWAIAKGQEWVPSYRNPQVAQALQDIAAPIPSVTAVEAAPGQGVYSRTADGTVLAGGGHGPELKITLRLAPGLTQDQLNHTVQTFQQGLAINPVISELVDSVQISLAAAS